MIQSIQKSFRLGLSTVAVAALFSSSVHAMATESATAQKRVASAWTFYGPDSSVWVRAITLPSALPMSEDKKCPTLTVDSQAVLMKNRELKSNDQFQVGICEAQVSAFAKHIEVSGETVPSPILNPKRIVVLGDTGCQIKEENGKIKIQACNDSDKWPFAQIGYAAAQLKPDLVIHVGDYHYREANCPPPHKSCKGAISGDRWESWEQDFFSPVAPLLKAAPWIFTRGNHELCGRAGEGWFRLLEPRLAPGSCSDRTSPYRVKLEGLSLAIIDSADDRNISDSLTKLSESLQGGEWLVLHRPILTTGADDEASVQSVLPKEMQGPGKLGLVLAGHQHVLSLNQFSDSRPPELITGNGGTELRKHDVTLSQGEFAATTYKEFGFLTLDRQPDSSWLVTVRDTQGNEITRCNLIQEAGKKTQITCKPVTNSGV